MLKIYFQYVKSYLPLLIILFSMFNLTCHSQSSDSKVLPKTKDTKLIDKVEKDFKSDIQEEKFDPNKDYKLIAIYLISKEPRALIKDLNNTEEGPKEFRVGDYLDELQSLSISKISLNPTLRVELTDENGLGFLLKPSSGESMAATATSKGSYGSRTTPTFFTGGGSKTKIKKAPSSTTSETTSASPSTSSATTTIQAEQKVEQKEEAKPVGTQETSTSQSLQAVQAASQASATGDSVKEPEAKPEPAKTTTTKPGDEGLGVSRPGNPFGSSQ